MSYRNVSIAVNNFKKIWNESISISNPPKEKCNEISFRSYCMQPHKPTNLSKLNSCFKRVNEHKILAVFYVLFTLTFNFQQIIICVFN
jgi:hypothetical protein